MNDELRADRRAMADFLQMAHPDGPWVLTAIPNDGGWTGTQTFHDAEAAAGWAAKQNDEGLNLYWTVQPGPRLGQEEA